MTNVLKIILSLSLSGTFLIVTLLLFKPLWKDRLSRQWQYYIWLIVLARLVLPFTPETNIMTTFFQHLEKTTQTQQTILKSPNHFIETQPEPIFNIANNNPAPAKSSLPKTTPVSTYLFLIWLIVVLILFVRKITIYQNFVHSVRVGQTPVDDIQLLNHFGKLVSEANIKRRIDLTVNPLISSPMLMGFFHPCIVLPHIMAADSDFYYTIRHEIIHYKRYDILYKWLLQITLCLHWFNPFIYVMYREINRCCELSCDEAVIFHMNSKEKIAYGDTLVNAMETKNYKNTSASIFLSQSTELLKERLDSIMKFKKKSKITFVSTLVLTLLYSVSAVTIGAYATSNKTKENFTSSQTIKNKVLQENGVYYIFCDGADENDKPFSSVTKGSIKFVLVRKDGYTSIGPFNNLNQLIPEVADQCENMMEKQYITPEEAELILKTAINIQSNTEFNFIENKTETGNLEEYKKLGIEKIGDSYYYKDEPLRIFVDLRADHSFVTFCYNKDGTIDLQLIRDENGNIEKVEYITETQTKEILKELNVSSSYSYEKEKKSNYVSRTDSLIQNFEKYKPYGVIYDADEDAVYYNSNQVKLFVAFQSHKEDDMTYSFDLCYQDQNTDSTLYLEAVKDDNGNIIEIRNLKEEIANNLLLDKKETSKTTDKLPWYNDEIQDLNDEIQDIKEELEDNLHPNPFSNFNNKDNNSYYLTMDATQILEDYGIVAKDLTKEQADQNIKDWMTKCDTKKGAYLLKSHSSNQYTTFIYYNGGGRYPWNMTIENNTININLYSNSSLATTDGYYLMYFTSPKKDADINLYLDGVKLDIANES